MGVWAVDRAAHRAGHLLITFITLVVALDELQRPRRCSVADDLRILEGIVTTVRPDGEVNIAPMGPRVDDAFTTILLRPYRSSETYANLARTQQGVLHVADDVELFARAAINRWESPPAMRPAEAVEGFILTDACRWCAFQVEELDDSQDRARMTCRVVDRGRERDFFGFNRAMHAVLEAAILATRLQFLPNEEILRQFSNLAVLIDKTGGAKERAAFELIARYVHASRSGGDSS